MKSKKSNYKYQSHAFHLVDPSPWPLFLSISLLITALGFVINFCSNKGDSNSYICFFIYVFFFLMVLFRWFNDIVVESRVNHTKIVRLNMSAGMKLFIVSEVMFFFALFWGYFYEVWHSNIALWYRWPSVFFGLIEGYDMSTIIIPGANTMLLTLSGFGGRIVLERLNEKRYRGLIHGLTWTIFPGTLFLIIQLWEYGNLPFDFSSDVQGSYFYMLTGFHGLHVFIGLIFWVTCGLRLLVFNSISNHKFLGPRFCMWYWIFVDVVWLFLWVTVYILGLRGEVRGHEVTDGTYVSEIAVKYIGKTLQRDILNNGI